MEGGHAAELGAENEERISEQSSPLEIEKERGGGLIEHFGVAWILRGDGLVAVPIADAFAHRIRTIEDLHEADALLAQTTREDAIPRVTSLHSIRGIIRAIHFQNVRGLAAEIGERGYGHLHLRGELIAGDARGEFTVAGEFLEMTLVESLQEVCGGAVGAGGDAIGSCEEADGILGIESGALIRGGQEGGAPVVARGLRIAARIWNGNVGRQIFVFGAERVVHPSTGGWKTFERLSGGHEGLAGAVRVRLRRHAVEEKEVVRALTELRQQVGSHLARLAAWFEIAQWFDEVALLALEGDDVAAGHGLVVVFKKSGLVVEGIDMAECTAAKDHDDAFGLRREVWFASGEGTRGVDDRANRAGCGEELITSEQIEERDAAETVDGLGKEAAAIEEGVHGLKILLSLLLFISNLTRREAR